ncbi:hypothetical protein CCR94_20620 [Rhodoblastus sphagnicola]|uniref:Threonine/serine exporter-like N-terminal domain-containing protein n=1 Tax=Rhodoblastus sphagnicola TaxID=333368 RepID=A0A2S6MY01_9HYPH|nr:threonine/serine exporter family protein [Rhodoblastus sphagnicola]MBB4198096.1 uncharacterized membrane protein YjjP (DUF1212 family) [Rhodoblastus sphagnicola]PPQ27236.1 hypothetical protein CCR94_20620 [Rhodoblastus sphagnicola]
MQDELDEDDADPVRMRHRDLERIANAALRVGRALMECGASVSVTRLGVTMTARGLGAGIIGVRVGYASIGLTVSAEQTTITRMISVGGLGVNHRLDMAVRALAARVAEKGGTVASVNGDLDRLIRETPRHPIWLVALATGVACAAFGRLLGVDGQAFAAVLLGGTVGQDLRRRLAARGVNPFVIAALVAFVAGSIGGWGARLLGSASVDMATIAASLLLVPGVPATNAQTDIMEGYPTVGSARAVAVGMMMIFAATGIWCAQGLLRAGA